MDTSWVMFRPEWYASDREIHAKWSQLVAVAVGDNASDHAALIAAAPALFNAVLQVVEHLDSVGELSNLPIRIQWDLRSALENARQPAYTPSQPISSGVAS